MNAYTLKLIALIFMIIDHIGYFFYSTDLMSLRLLGRISAPVFFFLFIESYHLTSNKKNYLKRLSLYSAIMMVSNYIIYSLYKLFNIQNISITPLSPNIFLSMTICFLIIETIKKVKSTKRLTLKFNFLFALLTLTTILAFTEYHVFALFMTLTFYCFRNHKTLRNITFVIGSIILPILSNLPLQMAMILSLIFINEYNGEKGNHFKAINKYFFYNFYILHIFIFSILNIFIQLLNK